MLRKSLIYSNVIFHPLSPKSSANLTRGGNGESQNHSQHFKENTESRNAIGLLEAQLALRIFLETPTRSLQLPWLYEETTQSSQLRDNSHKHPIHGLTLSKSHSQLQASILGFQPGVHGMGFRLPAPPYMQTVIYTHTFLDNDHSSDLQSKLILLKKQIIGFSSSSQQYFPNGQEQRSYSFLKAL